MQQEILDMLLKEEEVSWKTVLYDLVKTEQMDPWDVNITLLTKKYIEVIKGLQEHDLRVSGKVLLAAAILLKIKSSHLVDNDISKLDALINQTDEDMDELEDEFYSEKTTRDKQQFTLIPRNPQPRNRKVSIHDLVSALQRAMASKRKILAKIKPVKFTIPTRSIDIMEAINGMYQKVMYYSKKEKDSLTFTKLLPPRAGKQAKVYTFLPLLHLENHHKVEMWQKGPFDEIHVKLSKNKRK
jgi:segregation and condensation protein A